MKKTDKEILDRYIAGECTEEEKAQVIAWFVEDKYKDTLKYPVAEQFNQILEQEETAEEEEDLANILGNVHHQINKKSFQRAKRFSFGKVMFYFTKAAAVLFFPLLLWAVLHYFRSPVPVQGAGMAEIVAPRGARIHFTLPDGTRGWLNSESSLSYPLVFRGKTREVTLEGEGYFEVAKNKKLPFVVNSEKLAVKVLGTSFNLNAYPDDDETEITLLSGTVEVLKADGRNLETLVKMKPGEQVRVRKTDYRCEKKTVNDPYGYTAWKDGKLIFRNDPMEMVVKKLGRWYNVKFYLQEENLKDFRYHATFQYESLDEVLRLIKLTSPVDYRIIKRKKLPDGSFSKKKIILFAKKDFKYPE